MSIFNGLVNNFTKIKELLNNKANIDLDNLSSAGQLKFDNKVSLDGSNATFSNLSQTAKDNIINSYTLDYNNPIELTTSGMVSTANGFLLCQSLTTKTVYVAINGRECFRFAVSDTSISQNYGIYSMIPVFKGDIITWNDGFNSAQSVILPFISINN